MSNSKVIGHAKEEVIAREPLLAYCLEAFERELHAPGRRLCVIGYGFRGPHINQKIANALETGDLPLFGISPQSPEDFRQSARLSRHETRIRHAALMEPLGAGGPGTKRATRVFANAVCGVRC